MRDITPLHPSEVGQDQSRVVDGDTGPSIPYTSLGGQRNNLGVLLVVLGLEWSPPWLQARKIALLDPAEVGQDQNRVLGGDDGPSVPHTSQGIDT